jgi:hypothetical protein
VAGGVDRTALKVNQVGIIGTLLLAFLASALFPVAKLVVPLLAVVLLLGVLDPRLALFRQLYRRVLQPRGILPARPVAEDPRPHQFAQLLGGIFLALASLAFALFPAAVGWVLAWVVLLLALVNLTLEF